METMRHFYFTEEETGEEFIVGAHTLPEAKEIAEDVGIAIGKNYGVHYYIEYQYEMTEEEAEESGLDEY